MQKQQKEKDYRHQLRQLAQQPRWKITFFTALVNASLAWQALVDWYFYINFNYLFARRAFFKRTIKRAHWVGHQAQKPHRFAFLLLALVVLVGAFTAPGIQSLYWVIGWGSLFSIFVIILSFKKIIQRPHSIKRQY